MYEGSIELIQSKKWAGGNQRKLVILNVKMKCWYVESCIHNHLDISQVSLTHDNTISRSFRISLYNIIGFHMSQLTFFVLSPSDHMNNAFSVFEHVHMCVLCN